jgi:hypothetical protein
MSTVATRQGITTVRIIAEEKNNSDQLMPIDVRVYDVVIDKRIPRTQPGDASATETGDSFPNVTMREMLRGIKGWIKNIMHKQLSTDSHISPSQTQVLRLSRDARSDQLWFTTARDDALSNVEIF